MKRYEVMYIVESSREEEADGIKKKIEGIITGREGTIISFDKIGKKRLAYQIAKRQYGTYFLLNLSGNGKIVQALDYFFRMNPVILRHIVLVFTDKILKSKRITEAVQAEETERMRQGGRPISNNGDETDLVGSEHKSAIKSDTAEAVDDSSEDKAIITDTTELPVEVIAETVIESEETVADATQVESDNLDDVNDKPVE